MELVTGHLQAYDWGPVDGLAAWTLATSGPQAELWFGSHPNGPSERLDGTGVARSNLTILAKILAASRPLSIQIHPPALLASAMFERQQNDPALPALVSDPYGKAEILIALEPFVILEGFRDPTLSAPVFEYLGGPLAPVAEALSVRDLPRAITGLLSIRPDDVAGLAATMPSAFAAAGMSAHTVATIEEVVCAFPGDPGVFVAALLNARTLQPGQAVYVDPGTVHAYVRGLGVEVMTNSDNVLRLGLTSKTIAVDAALEALDLDAQPHPCDPDDAAGIVTYAPPGAPFTVEVLRDAAHEAPSGHSRIAVCLHGVLRVGDVELTPGQAALLEAGEGDIRVEAAGTAVLARHASAGEVDGRSVA